MHFQGNDVASVLLTYVLILLQTMAEVDAALLVIEELTLIPVLKERWTLQQEGPGSEENTGGKSSSLRYYGAKILSD